jgi:hypothetical protein
MQSQFGHVRESRRWALFCLVALGLALTPAIAGAQGVGTGTIEGKVSDESGGVMPGVTVTVSSPAMQLRQQMRVTDTEGTYRFVDLPIGVYRIQYELQGFQTFVREGLRLNAGFVARVDATLQVGSLAETVTVSGQSPVIDV